MRFGKDCCVRFYRGLEPRSGEVPFPPKGELLKNRQLALGGLRFFSISASVIIIIIIASTGHS